MSLVGFVRDFASADPKAVRSPSLGDPRGRFAARCLGWSRDRGNLHTQLVPGNTLPTDGPDRYRFAGFLMGPSRSGILAYLGFVAIVLSWLALTMSGRLRASAGVSWWLGAALGISGLVALLVAYGLHRRGRMPVDVVVDVGRARVTAFGLDALRQQAASDHALWVFARRGFEPSAALMAREGWIRCLSPSGFAFVDPPEVPSAPGRYTPGR